VGKLVGAERRSRLERRGNWKLEKNNQLKEFKLKIKGEKF